MRKIIVSDLVSLDGYFEGPNKEIDWFSVDDEFFEYARNLLRKADTLLFGRLTYEMMAAYWPNANDNDLTITHKMNNLPKIVFSKTLSSVEWNNATLVRENIPEEIIKMKQQPGKDMLIFGSGTLVSAFMEWGLVDEYHIIVSPVILGNGNPLFKQSDNKFNLKLLNIKKLGSGVIILFYEPV